jgi:peptidoglycan/xylan/chitin deacetylase (PgdA/CDA1 family)
VFLNKKMKYNIKSILTLTVNLCILLTAVLIITFILSSCATETQNQDNADKLAGVSQPEISVLSFELIDINGGDIYPGEKLAAVIKVLNSGEAAAENISLKLSLPEVLLPDGGSENTLTAEGSSSGNANAEITISGSTAVIKNLGSGETAVIELPLMVAGQLKQDITDTLGVIINRDGAGEVISKDAVFTVFGVAPYERDQIPIIGLHAIEEHIEIPIELSTFHFDVLCKTLKNFGFETITFTDLLNHVQFGRVLPEKSVIITSDDGFADLYSNALDVLKKYDYKMTVFIVTDFIKETDSERVTNYFDSDRPVPMRPMLIWPEVKEMDEYGCEFLSHSANHIRLGLATDDEFKEELSKSKKAIEDHLKKPVLFFAWPYDNNDPQKLSLLDGLGYIGAVRYWGGMENISTMDLKVIKRVEFNSLIAPESYATYLNLHSILIESKMEAGPVKAGREFILEYKIKNNDDMDLLITSIELELPQSVSLEGLEKNGNISQYPGVKDGIYMWVSDGYPVKAEDEINLRLRLLSSQAGTDTIKFRISAYNGYIEAEDVQINID